MVFSLSHKEKDRKGGGNKILKSLHWCWTMHLEKKLEAIAGLCCTYGTEIQVGLKVGKLKKPGTRAVL